MKIILLLPALFVFGLVAIAQPNNPAILKQDKVTVKGGDTLVFNILANDFDPDGDSLAILHVYYPFSSPSFMLAEKAGPASVRVVPVYGYTGTDSIRITIVEYRDGNKLKFHSQYFIVTVIPSEIFAYLDINNIKAGFLPNGTLFWDLDAAKFAVPQDSSTHSIFSSGLWIGGVDDGGQLHLAAQSYRSTGKDYWQGPVANTHNKPFEDRYFRIYKVTRKEIEQHKAGAGTAQVIMDWPAHGDTMNGEPLYLAPFSDMDQNGIYEPSKGDYPAIKGDQALYFIFNDARHEHTESGGKQLGIDIHLMAYAYEDPSDPVKHNTIFLNYRIVNRSDSNYSDVYIGQQVDFDLGHAFDDYVGSDSIMNAFFVYNGDLFDGPHVYGFDSYPPMQAFTFLNHDLSAAVSYDDHYPYIDTHYYHYLQGKMRSGIPRSDPNGQTTGFDYHDPINDTSGYNEYSLKNPPFDRRMVGSTGPFALPAGGSVCVEAALPFIEFEDTSGLGNDYYKYLVRLDSLYQKRINDVHQFYQQINPNCESVWSSVEIPPENVWEWHVYPNPAKEVLNVEVYRNMQDYHIELFDLNGRSMRLMTGEGAKTAIIVAGLPAGIYLIRLSGKGFAETRKVLIQK